MLISTANQFVLEIPKLEVRLGARKRGGNGLSEVTVSSNLQVPCGSYIAPLFSQCPSYPMFPKTHECPMLLCLPLLLTSNPRFPAVSILDFPGQADVRNWKAFKRVLGHLPQTQSEQLFAQSLSTLEFLVMFCLMADYQEVNKYLYRTSLILNPSSSSNML